MYITYLSFDRQSDAAILSRCRFKTPPDPRRSIYLFRFFTIIFHDMHTVQKAFCLFYFLFTFFLSTYNPQSFVLIFITYD